MSDSKQPTILDKSEADLGERPGGPVSSCPPLGKIMIYFLKQPFNTRHQNLNGTFEWLIGKVLPPPPIFRIFGSTPAVDIFGFLLQCILVRTIHASSGRHMAYSDFAGNSEPAVKVLSCCHSWALLV